MKDTELIFTLLSTSASVARRLDRSLSVIKGITFSEYQLLSTLSNSPGSTATRVDLADGVGLTPSAVTRALKPLEKIGYVETTKDARDARKSLAGLTDQGVELMRDADGVVGDVLDDMTALRDLSKSDKTMMAGFLNQVAAG